MNKMYFLKVEVPTLLFLFFVTNSLFSLPAFAGGESGGGGKSVVCRNSDGTIRSAELLDLYEGRVVYQLSYQESPVDWKIQSATFLENSGVIPKDSCIPWIPYTGSTGSSCTTHTGEPNSIEDYYVNTVNHLTFLPEGTTLKPIDDSYEVIAPKNCNIEQTVNYQNDNLILVDSEIWKALSETQKSALIVHESVYRYLRDYGEKDSRRARHFNAYIFSGGHVENTFPGDNYQLFCSGGDKENTFFYAFALPANPSESSKVRLQFASLGGRQLLSKSYVDLDASTAIGSSTTHLPDQFNLLDQLKNPTQWMRYQSIALQSLFEPGDTIDLWFHPVPEPNGKMQLQIVGTSIVDESNIGPVNITCHSLR